MLDAGFSERTGPSPGGGRNTVGKEKINALRKSLWRSRQLVQPPTPPPFSHQLHPALSLPGTRPFNMKSLADATYVVTGCCGLESWRLIAHSTAWQNYLGCESLAAGKTSSGLRRLPLVLYSNYGRSVGRYSSSRSNSSFQLMFLGLSLFSRTLRQNHGLARSRMRGSPTALSAPIFFVFWKTPASSMLLLWILSAMMNRCVHLHM